jgi:hypothetical protein
MEDIRSYNIDLDDTLREPMDPAFEREFSRDDD